VALESDIGKIFGRLSKRKKGCLRELSYYQTKEEGEGE